MIRRFASRTAAVVLFAAAVGSAVLALAAPAGAQQLVDAGGQGDGSGGLAFVLFAVMVAACAWAMFYMDRVRRRRASSEDQDQS